MDGLFTVASYQIGILSQKLERAVVPPSSPHVDLLPQLYIGFRNLVGHLL